MTMSFEENLHRIQERIHSACERAGRDPSSVLLLPISKGQPADVIIEAAEFGCTVFGESKVQEARLKISRCPSRLKWQMVGHLQSNKCRDALQIFQMIQSVDSIRIARELNEWAEKLSKRMAILLEVNVAGESTKYGFSPDELLTQFLEINQFSRLEIHGLMTIAPYSPDPEKARPYFKKLAELKERCSDLLGAPLPHLSMGMSGDFEAAIEEGSTIVRIGTALFGARQSIYKKSKED